MKKNEPTRGRMERARKALSGLSRPRQMIAAAAASAVATAAVAALAACLVIVGIERDHRQHRRDHSLALAAATRLDTMTERLWKFDGEYVDIERMAREWLAYARRAAKTNRVLLERGRYIRCVVRNESVLEGAMNDPLRLLGMASALAGMELCSNEVF